MLENDQAEEIILTLDDKLSKTISVLEEDLSSIRAGRANPHILDKVMVDYYGAMTPVTQTSNISVQEGRCLVISPWDTSLLKAIEKAIQVSNLGINPTNDGSVLRIAFPQLTEERRKELCKDVRKLAEDAKVAIRSIRRDANDKFKAMKKKNELSEDDLKDYEKEMQDLTPHYDIVISTGINVPPTGWYYEEIKHIISEMDGSEKAKISRDEAVGVLRIAERL